MTLRCLAYARGCILAWLLDLWDVLYYTTPRERAKLRTHCLLVGTVVSASMTVIQYCVGGDQLRVYATYNSALCGAFYIFSRQAFWWQSMFSEFAVQFVMCAPLMIFALVEAGALPWSKDWLIMLPSHVLISFLMCFLLEFVFSQVAWMLLSMVMWSAMAGAHLHSGELQFENFLEAKNCMPLLIILPAAALIIRPFYQLQAQRVLPRRSIASAGWQSVVPLPPPIASTTIGNSALASQDGSGWRCPRRASVPTNPGRHIDEYHLNLVLSQDDHGSLRWVLRGSKVWPIIAAFVGVSSTPENVPLAEMGSELSFDALSWAVTS